LKALIIAALLTLLLLLLYSRIYPYVQIIKKLFGGVARTLNDPPTMSGGTSQSAAGKSVGKLVRCVGCGTWIPTERAIGTGGGRPPYCSRECIEKSAASAERKAAS
jgi:hypothetical protein